MEIIETIANRFRYASEQYDGITGDYCLRARYYSPELGRFTQEDTFRGDGLNLYAYVANNPLRYVDPSGHEKQAQKLGENWELDDYIEALKGKLVWPVPATPDPMTGRPFSIEPVLNPVTGEWKPHLGTDIKGKTGADVMVALDGIVARNAVSKSSGNYIYIDSIVNGIHIQTRYRHLNDKAIPQAGEEVKAGQLIGCVGSTGDSTGPHLHLYKTSVNGDERQLICDGMIEEFYVINDKLLVRARLVGEGDYLVAYDLTNYGREIIGDGQIRVIWEYENRYYGYMSDRDLCSMNLDGTDIKVIPNIKGDHFNYFDGWVYYTNKDDQDALYKARIDGTELTKLSSATPSNIYIYNDTIYYIEYCREKDTSLIYKMPINGGESTVIN